MKNIQTWALTSLALVMPVLALADSPATRLDGPVLLKSHSRASSLVLADLDHNKLTDIATISNDEGLLRIYYGLPESEIEEEGGEPYRREEITLDRVIRSMASIDVNGNGRADLVLAADDASVAIYLQTEEGRLQKAPDVDLRASRLVVGELSGDQFPDLLLAETNRLQIVLGGEQGLDLTNPKVVFTPSIPGGDPLLLDLDGDGRRDIVTMTADSREVVVVRLQNEEGEFPAEFSLRTGLVRDIDALPMKGRRDILAAVQGRTRQVVLLQLGDLVEKEDDVNRLVLSDPRIIGFDPDRRDTTPFATVADVDGDGREDLIVEMPGTASIRVIRQTTTGSLVPSEFPSFRDVRSVVPVPVEKGQPTPLLVVSGSEKALGVSIGTMGDRLHLPFPTSLRTASRPLAAGMPRINGTNTLVVLEEGADTKTAIARAYPGFDPSGGVVGEPTDLVTLSNLKELPRNLFVADLDKNGADDLIVFYEYAPPGVLLQQSSGSFESVDPTGLLAGLLASTTPINFSNARLAGTDSDMVLVARDEFVRAFHLDDAGVADIKSQFNGRNSRSVVRAATVANLRGDDSREVVLYDTTNNVLTIYGATGDEDAYELIRHVDVAAAGYRSLRALDIDGDQRDDLVLVAPDRMAILYSRVMNGSLDTLDSVETDVEDGGYGLVRAISLTGDGTANIVALEMRRALLDFFHLVEEEGAESPTLERFRSFRVYDSEMSIAGRVNLDEAPEPREIKTGDLTGSGLQDIVMLVHDVIIVYTQHPAEDPKEELAGK
jgi:hypothetical protein